jgi:hypothetical protein
MDAFLRRDISLLDINTETCVKDHTKLAVIKFNIKHFICMQTQRFKSSVMLNHVDSSPHRHHCENLKSCNETCGKRSKLSRLSDKFYLQAGTMNTNG